MFPSLNNWKVSKLNVENVLKPPQNPMMSKNLRLGDIFPKSIKTQKIISNKLLVIFEKSVDAIAESLCSLMFKKKRATP